MLHAVAQEKQQWPGKLSLVLLLGTCALRVAFAPLRGGLVSRSDGSGAANDDNLRCRVCSLIKAR